MDFVHMSGIVKYCVVSTLYALNNLIFNITLLRVVLLVTF